MKSYCYKLYQISLKTCSVTEILPSIYLTHQRKKNNPKQHKNEVQVQNFGDHIFNSMQSDMNKNNYK